MHDSKFFVCYVPGVDLRRLQPEQTPYISSLFQYFPWLEIKTLPSSEMLSMTITGQWPHQHGIWQTRFVPNPATTLTFSIFERLPDALTTTFQCIHHGLSGGCDMSTVPPKRRKHFDLTRLKFHGRADTTRLLSKLETLGNPESLVSVLGTKICRYLFTDRFNDRDFVLENMASGDYRLDLVQFHSMDILGHWHLDTEEKFSYFYLRFDEFVRKLHNKCKSKGLTMILLSDHGQERVTRLLDLKANLRKLAIPENEYAYFMQAVLTRFWFHTDRARRLITEMLSEIEGGTVLHYRELYPYHVKFSDERYGELYFLANPGTLIFPDDFYHPLVNIYFGLKDWQKRRRLRTPVQLGYHGYLPHHDSEKGFMLVLDDRYQTSEGSMSIIDVAPTLLAMLDIDAPEVMTGKAQFWQ